MNAISTHRRWLLGSYLLLLISLFIPAESIRLNGETHTVAMYFQQSAWAMVGVAVVLISLQWIWQLKKQQWLVWPGIISGLLLLAFALLRMVRLWQMPELADKQFSGQPQLGLYLMAVAALALLLLEGLEWQRKAK
ncbi:MAG: hypothetical protein LCH58_07020 [Bacteroidetes bacterium]|uniref:hypothetical protein n=1 Tax=Phnomibacter sp. TaxID=2836217 RepID=UPI002FDECA0F|nr:hypothetical protein [Bacteroidota bacterium]